MPSAYKPDAPRIGNTRRQIILAVLITTAIFVLAIVIGLLAQLAHHAAR